MLKPRLETIWNKFNIIYQARNTSSYHCKNQNTPKTPFLPKTGQALQNSSQKKFHSCVLPWTTSNTLHTSHPSYPSPCPATVTSFSSFTIFNFWVCRLSSIGTFMPFQSKLSIGKGQGNIKQAQKSFRPHSKLLHCHIRTWLNKVISNFLSPYLDILRLRFVKQKCSP